MSCECTNMDQNPIQMGLDPSHQVTERDIHDYQLPEKIGRKWRDLARALKYSEASINRIQEDRGGSTKECCIEVLVGWRDQKGWDATVEKLAEALVKARFKNIADELMCIDTTQCTTLRTKILELEEDLAIQRKQQQGSTEQNDRFNMTISQMQTNCNCKHLEILKEEGSKMRRTIKELEDKYQDAERENSEMRSKMEQLETRLQDSEHECTSLRIKILEQEEDLAIQRKQQQDSTEQGLSNSVDTATGLVDVSGATGNDLDTDQENRERRIAIQLKRLDEKLKNEITSLLQVPEVKEDKLRTAVKLDLLTKLSESLQNIYSDIHAVVAETCKCNEDLKREFYDLAYRGLRAEHNDLVLRVKDLESWQAEMSDEEKKDFEKLQQYQINRQRQIDRLENFWRGLFCSPESLPETSSSYPTGGNNNSQKALSRNRTDPGTRQKQTNSREVTSAGTPPMSDEWKSEVCITTIKKFRSKKSKKNTCSPVSYRTYRDS